MAYNSEHPGATVSKHCFAHVFKIAYLKVVKSETAFKHAGIYPPSRKAIDEKEVVSITSVSPERESRALSTSSSKEISSNFKRKHFEEV